MADNGVVTLSRDAELTPVSDKKGHDILICDPEWFDERKQYKIANAPARTAALSFSGVCDAPGQFESVFKGTAKFSQADKASAQRLGKRECGDLIEAIDAVNAFLAAGPDANYQYDNFRGYNPTGSGTHIGRSRFWLSAVGADLLKKTP